MSAIGVYIELKNGQFKKTNRELLTLARKSGSDVTAVVFANEVQALEKELTGIQTLVQITGSNLDYQPDSYAQTLAEVIREHGLKDFLGGCSAQGKDLLVRVAARVPGSLVSDCLAVDLANHTASKPIYAGKLLAEYRLVDDQRLYAIRPNVIAVEPPTATSLPRRISRPLTAVPARTQITGVTRSTAKKVDLPEAEIIVSGGRGYESQREFRPARGFGPGAWRRRGRFAGRGGRRLRHPGHAGRPNGKGGQSQDLHSLRHLRIHPALCGHENVQGDRGHQQGPGSPHHQEGRLWHHRRSVHRNTATQRGTEKNAGSGVSRRAQSPLCCSSSFSYSFFNASFSWLSWRS